jgi:hypothetical protein
MILSYVCLLSQVDLFDHISLHCQNDTYSYVCLLPQVDSFNHDFLYVL